MTGHLVSGADDGAPASFRRQVAVRFAVRLHVILILSACFAVGLAATKLLLMAGVGTMWLRYAVALVMAYAAFLLGVRLWLAYTGYARRILPGRRSGLQGDAGLPDFGGGGGGGGGKVELPGFRGGGGTSGGGGASASFGGDPPSSVPTAQALAISSSSSSASASPASGSGGGFDLGDDGWVLLLLVGAALALAGGVVWVVYAAPTIFADAAFAGMLSAGLVRSTKHIASGGWVASVVGHTWIAFAIVLVCAVAFAVLAQRHVPDARTLLDVLRAL